MYATGDRITYAGNRDQVFTVLDERPDTTTAPPLVLIAAEHQGQRFLLREDLCAKAATS